MGRLESIESQVCGVMLFSLLLLTALSTVIVSWPLFLSLSMSADHAVCQVYQLKPIHGLTNCSHTWASCRDSCSAEETRCTQIIVQYWMKDNSTALVPLLSNVLGCGSEFSTCGHFYERFSFEEEMFECRVYQKSHFATPEDESGKERMKYLAISLSPLILLVVSCLYMKKRKMFAKGFKKAKKLVKRETLWPRSFYQRKMLELEFKKNLRKLKMKNTQNDVKVFDLEQAQTTGALILKPSFLLSSQPPKIII